MQVFRKLLLSIVAISLYANSVPWWLEKIDRCHAENPIISPNKESVFACPVFQKEVRWEQGHTFNPAAVVRGKKVYLLYRAEDESGKGVGKHTSRIGLAVSDDGIHFQRYAAPVLYPQFDDQGVYEYPGGCEDPRVVEREDGAYVLTYTQWDNDMAVLAVATSSNLLSWEKHGYAFKNHIDRMWSKSGAIVCKLRNNRLIATKIQGKYWMYWGDDDIYLAHSTDCVNWEPLLDEKGEPIPVMRKRGDFFDSRLIEPGPSPIITARGIWMIYNACNIDTNGDKTLPPHTYSCGQALFSRADPTRIKSRRKEPLFKPQEPYEVTGQYKAGTVFMQGMVFFKKKWFFYYGAADSHIAVAKSKSIPK